MIRNSPIYEDQTTFQPTHVILIVATRTMIAMMAVMVVAVTSMSMAVMIAIVAMPKARMVAFVAMPKAGMEMKPMAMTAVVMTAAALSPVMHSVAKKPASVATTISACHLPILDHHSMVWFTSFASIIFSLPVMPDSEIGTGFGLYQRTAL